MGLPRRVPSDREKTLEIQFLHFVHKIGTFQMIFTPFGCLQIAKISLKMPFLHFFTKWAPFKEFSAPWMSSDRQKGGKYSFYFIF